MLDRKIRTRSYQLEFDDVLGLTVLKNFQGEADIAMGFLGGAGRIPEFSTRRLEMEDC